MQPIDPRVSAYAEHYSGGQDVVFEQVIRDTLSSHPRSHMMSGKTQGKFLEIFSKCLQPLRVLEIGTFTGYSALCLASGLAPGGMLHTIELREEESATAEANFKKMNWNDRIILHTGDALKIIPDLMESWDLVFLDADKTGYVDYYELILPSVKKGGIIIADNVLFHGKVLAAPVSGKQARAIARFNDHVREDDRVEQVMLTVRDGLMLIRKR